MSMVGIATGGWFFYQSQKSQLQQKVQNTTAAQETIEPSVEGEKTYTDTAGFYFNYPEAVSVEDITPNDNTYYTLLSITKDGKEITIEMKDVKYKTLDEWLTKDPNAPQGTSVVGATALGGLPSTQYATSSEIYTVSLEKGILYLIKGPKDNSYFEKLQDLVVSSLTFGQSQAKTTAPTTGGGGVIYEEEEIIE